EPEPSDSQPPIPPTDEPLEPTPQPGSGLPHTGAAGHSMLILAAVMTGIGAALLSKRRRAI
ncbi:MAG: LPXTG cell wall anchor domain-containing protein, partial [Bowdeniella nasicola]|nr:LPXTG cell wall anchor domain-containing protein [Bowdeniella nasicola]